MSFINITAPAPPADKNVASWNTTYLSTSLNDVKLWSLTLTGSLTNYPGVKTMRNFQVWVHHPCEFAEILPTPITNMRFAMGFPQEILQFFMNFNETVSGNYSDATYCGPRVYDQLDGFVANFLKIIEPADPWVDPYALSLYTLDPFNVGNYTVTMYVSLKNFPMVKPLAVVFDLTIEFSTN
jgi:hypothetical protein